MSMLVNPFVFAAAAALQIGVNSNWYAENNVASSTTLTVNLPAAAQAGDLCIFATVNTSAASCTWTAGWTELDDRTGTRPLAYCYKVLNASDISAGNVTCTFSVSVTLGRGCTFIVRNHNVATSAPVDNTGASGTSTTPNPASTSHSWGTTVDTCFIALYAGASKTADPSGYTSVLTGTGTSVNVAYKIAKASSDDAGTFTQSSNTAWRANCIAVRGLV